jgi:GT2 family glycosyltransferase
MLFHALYLHRVPLVRALMANPAKTLSELGVGHEVDAILGAAMFARRRVIEEVNGFDEEFLYTCEDIDLCLRLRARGSRIFYLADAEVVHFVGRSSAQASLRSGTMSILSMERYFAQSHGRFHALTYRLLVQVVQMPMLITVGFMKTIVNRTGLNELRHRVRFANAIWRWRISE